MKMHLHCNLCTGGFGCGPGNCGTVGLWDSGCQPDNLTCFFPKTFTSMRSSVSPSISDSESKQFEHTTAFFLQQDKISPHQKPAHTHCPANLGGVTKISYFATLLVVCVALKANLSHNLEKAVHCIVFLEVATVKANQQVIRIPGEKIRLFKR